MLLTSKVVLTKKEQVQLQIKKLKKKYKRKYYDRTPHKNGAILNRIERLREVKKELIASGRGDEPIGFDRSKVKGQLTMF